MWLISLTLTLSSCKQIVLTKETIINLLDNILLILEEGFIRIHSFFNKHYLSSYPAFIYLYWKNSPWEAIPKSWIQNFLKCTSVGFSIQMRFNWIHEAELNKWVEHTQSSSCISASRPRSLAITVVVYHSRCPARLSSDTEKGLNPVALNSAPDHQLQPSYFHQLPQRRTWVAALSPNSSKGRKQRADRGLPTWTKGQDPMKRFCYPQGWIFLWVPMTS